MCNDIKLNYNQGSITCNLALYSLLLMAYVPLHYRFLLFKDKTICMQILSREYLIVNITAIKASYLLYNSLYTYTSFWYSHYRNRRYRSNIMNSKIIIAIIIIGWYHFHWYKRWIDIGNGKNWSLRFITHYLEEEVFRKDSIWSLSFFPLYFILED